MDDGIPDDKVESKGADESMVEVEEAASQVVDLRVPTLPEEHVIEQNGSKEGLEQRKPSCPQRACDGGLEQRNPSCHQRACDGGMPSTQVGR